MDGVDLAGSVTRVIRLTEFNEYFWLGGLDGELRFYRCAICRYWIHPPSPTCPECLSLKVRPEAVSGGGEVYTFTVNTHQWRAGEEPYIIVIVSLDEQPDLRLLSNLIGCNVEAVHIGMRVEVVFEPAEVGGRQLSVPLFRPTEARQASWSVANDPQ
ncbi:MAG: OB-fold domain-containing protein [Vicinamibacterales bacterium]|nr:OB-fold domain-containing protein [Vicinamibacterales bacterium]